MSITSLIAFAGDSAGDSAKVSTRENFPLYGSLYTPSVYGFEATWNAVAVLYQNDSRSSQWGNRGSLGWHWKFSHYTCAGR